MQMVKSKRKRIEAVDVVSAVVLTLLVLVIILPFYTALVTSITTNMSYIKNPVQFIPDSFTLDNYKYVLDNLDILTGYKNTLFVVIIGTLISVTVELMYAYALSMEDYPGKKIAFVFLIVTMYFGGGLIPTYMLVKNLKLINNPLAVVFLCGVSPYYITIIRNGILGVPGSVLDAARIDGAGEGRIFAQIVVPLIKPVVVTFTLFSIVNYWNEWYWSLILLTKPATKTLQIMLRTVVNSLDSKSLEALAQEEEVVQVFNQGLKMAAVVITMLPIMILYPFLQKHFAAGMMVGAVKM